MKIPVAFFALAAVAQTTAIAQTFYPGSVHVGYSSHHHHGYDGYHNHGHSSIHVGFGFYPSYYYAPYRYPVYGYGYPYPAYYYSAPVSSRAATGMALGTIAGAAIGANSSSLHHDAWAGAAIGAASGWLLGSVADSRAQARENESAAMAAPAVATTTTPAPPQTSPQTVIINNNYYGNASPMSSANSLFGR